MTPNLQKPLNQYIDHTLLRADATEDDIKKLCKEAMQYNFYSVCINPCYVKLAKQLLEGSRVNITTVIGFPLGASSTSMKVMETDFAFIDGADEIDMVINIGYVKSGRWNDIKTEITQVCNAAHIRGGIAKVILETCLLNEKEIIKASKVSLKAGADFIKTSTGFSTGGATTEDIKCMKKVAGSKMKVKASGGIRSKQTAIEMIEAGADRLGISASVKIMEE